LLQVSRLLLPSFVHQVCNYQVKKPDESVIKALCALKSQSPDAYLVIQQWFMDSSGDQDRALRNAEAPHILYRAQGASKELLECCEIFADPYELAGKLAMKKDGIRLPT